MTAGHLAALFYWTGCTIAVGGAAIALGLGWAIMAAGIAVAAFPVIRG